MSVIGAVGKSLTDGDAHAIEDEAKAASSGLLDAAGITDAQAAVSKLPWYQRGTIYELNIRSFADGNGDGIGDFAGATTKLDHVQSLGSDAIWMLPFNESPMRDGGYDVSNFMGINKDFGTLEDFDRFVNAAHDRGIKVIADFPLNHSSIDHPWFERARSAPAGSAERDFYVWSDTGREFADAPINFADFEKSNWTWDDKAHAYYFHRWYSHQPDLNWDSPHVVAAMKQAMGFWFDHGVDGLRLDAAPFLVEREGTNCESLPETHAVLRDLRAWIDAEHPGKMLLAEANEPPEELARYFGGDALHTASDAGSVATGIDARAEMHMAFNFPLMPRLFQAFKDGSGKPILDGLAQTSNVPDGAAFATFARNHDELTLFPVDDTEKESMRAAYAPDPQQRVLGGIRRRLAPLLGGDPQRIDEMDSLLMSLPGTPVIYNGDEIGMGDNVLLRDRDAVRTPMQWTSDSASAGFSKADPASYPIPVVSDPRYAPPAVNVADQAADPDSLLSRLKSLIATRKAHPALQAGSFQHVAAGNDAVLAYAREFGDDRVLAVANLSDQPQRATITAHASGMAQGRAGARLSQIAGRGDVSGAPDESDGSLTLAPYAYRWYSLA